jgi:hypothetical protein
MSDLRERAPAHSLIDELLRQRDLGAIHVDAADNSVVTDDEALGWSRGVIGERRITDLLKELGGGWTVLHSVPVGKGTSDIDHIAIGPSGHRESSPSTPSTAPTRTCGPRDSGCT